MGNTTSQTLKIYINGSEVENTLTNISKSLREFRSKANREKLGTDKWKEYNAEVAKLETELKGARNAQKEFREDTKLTEAGISKSEQALSKFTGSFSTMLNGYKTGDFLQVKEGFDGIKTGIKGAAKAAWSFIATPLGAFLVGLLAIGTAAKAWFNYNNQVVEALKLTSAITQLTDSAADQARINAETLQEVYGTDFKETLETAKKLVVQFGISYDEAFAVIEDGLKRGQGQNEEYFDSLGEYGTFFKQAGYSAQEFKDVISTGYDLGIYKDKLPDALKEADLAIKEQTQTTKDALVNAFGAAFTDDLLKRVRTGETTTKQALQEIAAQSEKTGINIQQNAQLTADLFKGAGEDAGGALKVFEALNVALNDQIKPLTESQQLLEDQAKATKELKQLSSALFTTGNKGWGLLVDKAKLFGTKILVGILKTGIDVYNWMVDLNNESAVFSAMLTGFGKSATAGFEIIGILLKNLWEGLKGIGNVFEGIFTLNPAKIKEGFAKGFNVLPAIVKDVKNKVVKDAGEIYDALSGKNKLKRMSLEDFTAGDTASTDTGLSTSTTDNPTGGGEDELTDEDKKIIASKKKVAEFLKQFNEEQAIQKEIEDLEKNEADQLKEELEKQTEYDKLIEEAEGDKQLIADLEEAKNVELAAIKKKWDDKFWADNKKNKKKVLEDDKKYKEDILRAEETLQAAKADAIFAGLGIIKSFAKEGSAAYKAIFLVEKAAAAAEVVINGISERAKIAELWAGVPAVSTPLLIASKIRTGISLATIAATTIKGFDEGGPTWNGPNSGGVDGIGGKLVRMHPNEYVIPQPVMNMPEVPRIVEYLEAKRTGQQTPSFEDGGAAEEMEVAGATDSGTDMNATLILLNATLQNLKINFTLEDEQNRQNLQSKLDDTKTASKN